MDDIEFMKLAINIAKSGSGQTSPNPVVGAVVVKNGSVVGIGAHLKAGEAHAEVHAINMAGEKAEDSTVYVTLEPCSHFGRTPPCAELLIASKVKRVVIATSDPNPKVSGNGISLLEKAGIEVRVGVLKEEADLLNPVFYHNIKTKLPFITVKSAMSLDGKIATSIGESKWITSEKSRSDSHSYRNTHDAILVGINTVLADNPSLTTRLPNGGRNPIRIILDTKLRIPLDSNVIKDQEASTWIITGKDADAKRITELQSKSKGIVIIQMKKPSIELKDMLMLLGEKGVTSIFVEGGSEVSGSFIKEKLVNQIITYIAPKIIGGRDAPTSIGGIGFERISDVLDVTIQSIEKIGSDIKIVSVPK
ncbi:bifunctional diaminohydroxyphosphoribosylaminopyrimidine deaminase/5-amino-6-(5-phosphoribosylamino)uracil reductase RibD [Bacillus timonensis]|nr:bifunctional diaminohydroxyphosphoribosylaminopyrimidine deaminase/5-amino-6-(5-phosphoribosylamino)uracil reductase RibD [Bacillus timonensis]